MSANGDFEDDWEPVSPAEMKVIQAKQERSNKISKIMGDYLLKGYKMLASSCDDCGCILLQDKQSQLYCVACNECEVEGSKDDPALSRVAADSKIREGSSPGAAAAEEGMGGDAPGSAFSSPSSLALTGIPSLMNASPVSNGNGSVASPGFNGVNGSGSVVNGSDVGAVAATGSGAAAAATTSSSTTTTTAKTTTSTNHPKNRHKGKMTSRVGGRALASGVGVRSLMCDVGRNAYEAFSAYQEDGIPPPPPPAATAATSLKSATPPPPSLPPPPPLAPHGPPVMCGEIGKLEPAEYESLGGTLKRKLITAGQRLAKSESTDEDKALCLLIKSYAEALEAVNNLQNS